MATLPLDPASIAPGHWRLDEDSGIYSTQSSQAIQEDAPAASQSSQMSEGRSLPERGKGTGAWNTPITYTESAAQKYGFDVKKAEERNKRLGEETRHTTVGPMPVDEFLAMFFDSPNVPFDTMPPSANAFASVPAKPDKEADIYTPLIAAINASADGTRESRCPGFTFRDTSNHADSSGGRVGAKKPDVCCYANHHLDLVAADDSKGEWASRTDMGLAATYFEIKSKPSADVFSDPPKGADRASWEFVFRGLINDALNAALEILGQHTTYASEIGMRQYRLCVYSIAMAGTIVRLLRWDRGGLIVTEAFNIHKRPDYLCKFLWCFAHVTDTVRGYDLTAVPARAKDEELFVKLVEAHIKSQLHHEATKKDLREALGVHYTPGSVTSVFVSRAGSDTQPAVVPYEYLVSRPMVAPLSMIGRGTRGYWAVDPLLKKVVFMKDTWRLSGSREGIVMKDLLAKNVPVPPVEYHGDVPIGCIQRGGTGEVLYLDHGRSQKTMTHCVLESKWVCGSGEDTRGLRSAAVVRRVRYRLVLGYAGLPLTSLRGTSELLNGAYGALEGLRLAYEKCGRLHRDISPANIILYNNGSLEKRQKCRKGYLIDWELSCRSDSPEAAHRPHASMVWQFMSVAALTGEVPCKIQDDMESIYYVVLHCALLYLEHNLVGQDLHNALKEVFDWTVEDTKLVRRSGGSGKIAHIYVGQNTRHIEWKNKDIALWLKVVKLALQDYMSKGTTRSGDEWSPSKLAQLWNEHLAEHPLSKNSDNDRCDNVQAHKRYFSSTAPPRTLGRAVQATIPYTPSPAVLPPRPPSAPPAADGETTPTASTYHAHSDVALQVEQWRSPPDLADPSSIATFNPSLRTLRTPASAPTSSSNPTHATVGLSGPLEALLKDSQEPGTQPAGEAPQDFPNRRPNRGKREPSPDGDRHIGSESSPPPKRARPTNGEDAVQ